MNRATGFVLTVPIPQVERIYQHSSKKRATTNDEQVISGIKILPISKELKKKSISQANICVGDMDEHSQLTFQMISEMRIGRPVVMWHKLSGHSGQHWEIIYPSEAEITNSRKKYGD